MTRGEVIRRRRDSNGNPIGRRNLNPILDTREYEVLSPMANQRPTWLILYLKDCILKLTRKGELLRSWMKL